MLLAENSTQNQDNGKLEALLVYNGLTISRVVMPLAYRDKIW